MPAGSKRTRRRMLIAACAAVATGLLVVVAIRSLPRVVTIAALSDARALCADLASDPATAGERLFEGFTLFGRKKIEAAWERRVEELATRYDGLFRAGYFDHAYLLGKAPRAGFTPEGLPPLLVVVAYYTARKEDLERGWVDDHPTPAQLEEITLWTRLIFRSAGAKETLVHALVRDHEPLPGRPGPGAVSKYFLIALAVGRNTDDYGHQRIDNNRLWPWGWPAPGDPAWSAVLRHLRHETAAVRAGSLLLLLHHPEAAVATARAREALGDPSALVRIAAGSLLAHHRDTSGEGPLLDGLRHERWEVRWWCGKMLTYLGEPRHRAALEAQKERETDDFVKRELGKMWSAFEPAAE